MNDNPFDKNNPGQANQDFFDINKIIAEQETEEPPLTQAAAASQPAAKSSPAEYTEDTNPAPKLDSIERSAKPVAQPAPEASVAAKPAAPKAPKRREFERALESNNLDQPITKDIVLDNNKQKSPVAKGLALGIGAFLIVLLAGWWLGTSFWSDDRKTTTTDDTTTQQTESNTSGLSVGPGLSLEGGKIGLAGLSLEGCGTDQVVGWDGNKFGCTTVSADISSNTNYITQKIYKTEVNLRGGGGLAFDQNGRLGVQTCANGQILKYNNGWTCANDENTAGVAKLTIAPTPTAWAPAGGDTIYDRYTTTVAALAGKTVINVSGPSIVNFTQSGTILSVNVATGNTISTNVTIFYQ